MQIGKRDIMWSYLAQGLRWGQSLIVLPVVLRVIPAEQMAFWYLFATISSLVMLFDFGFSATIVRNITYVFSGTKTLLKEGISSDTEQGNEVDSNLLRTVIDSSKYIYKLLSAVIFIVLLVAGTYYVYEIIQTKGVEEISMIWLAWGLTAINTTTSFYYLYLNALLYGRGYIRHVQKATVVTNLLGLALTFTFLWLGFGIAAMAISAFITVIINRLLCRRYFYDAPLRQILVHSIKPTKEHLRQTISIIWFNAKKTGVVAIGAFLITRVGQFLVTSFFALSVAAQYGLTMQVITMISGLAVTYISVMYPKITHDYFNGNIEAVRRHFSLMAVVIFLTFLICGVGLVLFGEPLLVLIKSQTHLLPRWQVAALLLVFFLESQHAAFSNIHQIQNRIPFVKPAIISGAAILIITYLMLTFVGANLWYVIGVQFVVQAAYNNWKWIYDTCKKLNTTYLEFYKLGFAELLKYVFK
ncbi:MAG: O-unit flippase-like protein [Mucinivorans sp.]